MTTDADRAPGHDPESWHFTLDDFLSADSAMRSCLDLARVAARTDLPILILGESGSGKTMLARAIHNTSPRQARGGPFVAFNAAALSDTLLDSQLFGHERGAFTGATRRVKGKFELANGGTLFIDEIADMTAAAQAKILRAVEYGEFERLGSEALQVADVRVISATHLPLQRFLETEHFRKDLFYRISGITLSVPPLRQRAGDLRQLVADEIAAASAAQRKPIIGLSKAAADILFRYHWPGNLRELKRVVHSAVALSSGDVILPDAILIESPPAPAPDGHREAAGAAHAPAPQRLSDAPVPIVPHDDSGLRLDAVERRHIRDVLARMGGNKRRAARALGLSRSTLDRKLSHFPENEAR
jgi:transcriptional regulator with PAS, ATPase and Fis domain